MSTELKEFFKLSIITINLNNRLGLANTILSIECQENKHFEYLVIDGKSNDGSTELLNSIRHPYYRSISEPDLGIYNAFNKGILMASGKYILFLNSGDELLSSLSVDLILKNLNQNYKFNVFNCLQIDTSRAESSVYLPTKISLEYLLRNFIPHPSTLIYRSVFDEIGLYDENFKFAGDHEFFIRAMILKYSFCVQNEFVSKHYLDGLSNNSGNISIILNERRLAVEKNVSSKFISDSIFFYLEYGKFKSILRRLKIFVKFLLFKD